MLIGGIFLFLGLCLLDRPQIQEQMARRSRQPAPTATPMTMGLWRLTQSDTSLPNVLPLHWPCKTVRRTHLCILGCGTTYVLACATPSARGAIEESEATFIPYIGSLWIFASYLTAIGIKSHCPGASYLVSKMHLTLQISAGALATGTLQIGAACLSILGMCILGTITGISGTFFFRITGTVAYAADGRAGCKLAPFTAFFVRVIALRPRGIFAGLGIATSVAFAALFVTTVTVFAIFDNAIAALLA